MLRSRSASRQRSVVSNQSAMQPAPDGPRAALPDSAPLRSWPCHHPTNLFKNKPPEHAYCKTQEPSRKGAHHGPVPSHNPAATEQRRDIGTSSYAFFHSMLDLGRATTVQDKKPGASPLPRGWYALRRPLSVAAVAWDSMGGGARAGAPRYEDLHQSPARAAKAPPTAPAAAPSCARLALIQLWSEI